MKKEIRISKFLSYVLRHHPESIGLTLDANGWGSVEMLIEKAVRDGFFMTREDIEQVVHTNDKKRFSLNSDKSKIRANQGHSIDIDLELTPQVPPEFLYHGTARHFTGSILSKGIKPKGRQYVHLSWDYNTAVIVGGRHGSPVVLEILSKKMSLKGHLFYLSENGVWLTSFVPTDFIVSPPLPKK